MSTITVTRTGMVHLGNNQWESLERIQQAVATAQTTVANGEGREGQMASSPHMNCNSCPSRLTCNHPHEHQDDCDDNQQPLELPVLNFDRIDNRGKKQSPKIERVAVNKADPFEAGHLPLPRMTFARK